MTTLTGYCFIAKNGRGKEMLAVGSFASSISKTKRRMNLINEVMCMQHRPMLEPLRIVKLTVTVGDVVREVSGKDAGE